MERRDFLASLGAAAVGAPEQPLYLLTYDHGGLVLWGIPHFAEKLREAIAWLDRYPGFKIGLDNEAYTYDYLAAHDPKMLAELRGYLAKYKSRFGIGTCTYGQPLSEFVNEESNIRQIEYALEADRRYFGVAPRIYLMSEHAMHSQIPQILAGFGFEGAIMRTHFMMYGYNPTFDLPNGWWRGLDGSRIATVPTYKGEGAEFGRTTVDNWILTRCPGPECRGNSLEDFRSKFGHLRPMLATRADDSGLRREDLVKTTEGNSAYRWVLLEDLPAILPKPREEMPTAPNDFVVRMPWGYCGNEIWNHSRRAEVSVLTAERAAAVGLLLGGEGREAELRRAWKNLLVAQHHDIQICGLLPDARKFLGASLAASEAVTEAAVRAVASRMKGGDAAQITVFNPRSWRQGEWVEAKFTLPARYAKAIEIRHGGRAVPSVLLSALRSSSDTIQEARVAFFADAPPLGFASYSVAPAGEAVAPSPALSASGLNIETPHWRIALGAEGGIASLSSVESGRTMFERARFAGRIDGRECESRGAWRVLPGPDGARWIDAREQGAIGGIPYRLDLRVWADSPRLDCRVTFEFEAQKIGRVTENKREAAAAFLHEEKLRFKLQPALSGEVTGVRDLPFAVAETQGRYVEGNYWTALASTECGLAFFNRGAMGAVREQDGGFALPLAYSMYYIWGTRMLNGEFAYEFALWPFAGGWRRADLHRRALEYNFPFVARAGEPGDGRLGEFAQPVEFASDDALITALYSGNGRVFARVFAHRGGTAVAHLTVSGARLMEVDLSGRDRGAVRSPLELRPWQFRTVRIDTQTA